MYAEPNPNQKIITRIHAQTRMCVQKRNSRCAVALLEGRKIRDDRTCWLALSPTNEY